MFIILAISALVFIVGLSIMMRNEDKCMRRNEPSGIFCRKHP